LEIVYEYEKEPIDFWRDFELRAGRDSLGLRPEFWPLGYTKFISQFRQFINGNSQPTEFSESNESVANHAFWATRYYRKSDWQSDTDESCNRCAESEQLAALRSREHRLLGSWHAEPFQFPGSAWLHKQSDELGSRDNDTRKQYSLHGGRRYRSHPGFNLGTSLPNGKRHESRNNHSER